MDVDVVMIGAGFAGLGAAVRLERRGGTSFVVLERAERIGGTWRDNVYPGVSCDIPSHLYSYSFAPEADWSTLYAPGAEIQGYLERVVEREGLAPRLRLGTEVLEAVFDEQSQRWRVRTSRGDYSAAVLLVCAGRLSEPRLPAVPGLDAFAGPAFHSARWREDVDLDGARVGIVGSGASAVQIVPHLAERAAEVVLFQRSAPYVVPRRNRAYPPHERRTLSRAPGALSRLREQLFWRAELGFAGRVAVPEAIDRLRAEALGHLAGRSPIPSCAPSSRRTTRSAASESSSRTTTTRLSRNRTSALSLAHSGVSRRVRPSAATTSATRSTSSSSPPASSLHDRPSPGGSAAATVCSSPTAGPTEWPLTSPQRCTASPASSSSTARTRASATTPPCT